MRWIILSVLFFLLLTSRGDAIWFQGQATLGGSVSGGFLCDGGVGTGTCNGTSDYLFDLSGGKLVAL